MEVQSFEGYRDILCVFEVPSKVDTVWIIPASRVSTYKKVSSLNQPGVLDVPLVLARLFKAWWSGGETEVSCSQKIPHLTPRGFYKKEEKLFLQGFEVIWKCVSVQSQILGLGLVFLGAIYV